MHTSTSPSVLITGASSGIGFSTAAFFLARGWQVYGMSRSGRVPEGVISVVADITDSDSVHQAIQQLLSATPRLDAVVNAAGIGGAGALETFPLSEAQKIMGTNYFGMLYLLQATLPIMRQQGSGTFVAISSIAGLMGVPFHSVYSASKFAVEATIEAVRLELVGSGVRALSICPGDTATPIIGNQYRAAEHDVPDFYRANFKKTDDAMRLSVDKGIPPEQVAEAIYNAVLLPHPAVRYPVGDWLQRVSPTIKRWLPASWFESIMRQYYGISEQKR